MTTTGIGPKWRIDGPPPEPPLHTLLQAARVVDDVDAGEVERWLNGVEVYPYPDDLAVAWNPYEVGSDALKAEGGTVALPEFGAMVVYLAETCSTQGIYGGGQSAESAQTRFVARANRAFGAVEAAALEREFIAGDVLPANPHLSDANADVLWGGSATSVVNAFALLENAIAETGRRGLIHCSPALATAARSEHLLEPDNGVLRTINGTPVAPGYGYVGAPAPDGEAEPGASEEWAYATGPVDVRRSEASVLPDRLDRALDRDRNVVTYRIERYYLIDWDAVLQAAVLVDRCSGGCGSPS